MGTDLLNACIFCAATLFGRDLSAPPGLAAEIAASYATLARRYENGAAPVETSDVTAKFVSIGMGSAHLPEAGLGAGTPDREWRLRVALAPSHDEQRDATPARGDGRYENLALLYRLPVGAHDSLEAGLNRRKQEAADLLLENFTFFENRSLTAERAELGLGWRHRWKGFEAALTARLDHVDASNGTRGAFFLSKGNVAGAGLEGRVRLKRWTLSLEAETLDGSIHVYEESEPAFLLRSSDRPVTLQFVRLGVRLPFENREAALSVAYDRSRLPFVALAVLGTETTAFDTGFHPESRTRQWIVNVSAGHWIVPRVRARMFFQATYGRETVTLTDALGARPTRTLPIQRAGVVGLGIGPALGSPEFVLGLAADLSLSEEGR